MNPELRHLLARALVRIRGGHEPGIQNDIEEALNKPSKPLSGTVLHGVFAKQGCYSDQAIWTVALYLDRAKAEEHAKLAQAWANERLTRFRAEDGAYRRQDEQNPYDFANGYEDDLEFFVGVEFVCHDPMNHLTEHASLMDYCREKGWVP